MGIGFIFPFPIEKLTHVAVLLGPNAAISRELDKIIFGRHLPKTLLKSPLWRQTLSARFHYRRINGLPIKGYRYSLRECNEDSMGSPGRSQTRNYQTN